MTFLPDDLYATIERSIPIACVDFVPVRETGGRREVGLIRRDSPFGRVWCHLGGRVLYGETLEQALQRHARDTLQAGLLPETDRQPDYVYQWFPDEVAPTDATPHGRDPRKHAIGLSYVGALAADPHPRNEAHEFAWFAEGAWPEPMWPGSAQLLEHLLGRQAT